MGNIVEEFKQFLRVISGRDICVKKDHECPRERFGSEYGGWNIATEGINKASIVYSFGIGNDASFDKALIEKYGLIVHAFDPTPQSIQWVKGQENMQNFMFHEYGIADFDGEAPFNPPENPEYVSHTLLDRPRTKDRSIIVPVKRLSTIMKELGHDRIDILKMDIEGAEFAVLADMGSSHIYPGQILVEFHHRFLPGMGGKKTKGLIGQLRAKGYSLFFVSENNKEFCFIRNKTVLS